MFWVDTNFGEEGHLAREATESKHVTLQLKIPGIPQTSQY